MGHNLMVTRMKSTITAPNLLWWYNCRVRQTKNTPVGNHYTNLWHPSHYKIRNCTLPADESWETYIMVVSQLPKAYRSHQLLCILPCHFMPDHSQVSFRKYIVTWVIWFYILVVIDFETISTSLRVHNNEVDCKCIVLNRFSHPDILIYLWDDQ